MSESRRKHRGFGHDAREPLKRQGIQTRCWRVAENIGDSDMMLECHRKNRGVGHNVEEAPMDLGSKQLRGRGGIP